MRGSLFIFSFKGILFAAALAVFCAHIGRVYADAAGKNLVNAWNERRFQEFYDTEPNTLDMVFIGSSHSYCTFDPLLIDEALGVNSYQMGMPLQSADGSYYTLREILNHQTPAVVVMEVYWKLLDKAFDLKQAETLFQVLDNEPLKREYIENGFPVGERVKYALPFIRFQQDFLMYQNNELLDYCKDVHGLEKTTEVQAGTEFYSDKGFMHCDYQIPPGKMGTGNQFYNFDGKVWALDANQRRYLDKIVALCQQNNIRLVFVTAPVANISLELMQNYETVHQTIAGYADERDVLYLDFNRINIEERLFTNAHFRDDAHLNYNGAVIACRYFAEFLRRPI